MDSCSEVTNHESFYCLSGQFSMENSILIKEPVVQSKSTFMHMIGELQYPEFIHDCKKRKITFI